MEVKTVQQESKEIVNSIYDTIARRGDFDDNWKLALKLAILLVEDRIKLLEDYSEDLILTIEGIDDLGELSDYKRDYRNGVMLVLNRNKTKIEYQKIILEELQKL